MVFAPDALSGRAAVVTGGSRGIGRGIVETLARAGATVTFCGRDGDSGERVRAELASAGLEAMPLKAKRIGRPADIGAAVTFLASPAADFITGAHLRIDGGKSAAV